MEPAIVVENLCKSYETGRTTIKALQGVSFSVGKGEVFGLLGANGAGKSTTIECVLGTRRPDSGLISVLGKDPQNDRKLLFERVGVQFQESSCQDKITVRELCEETQSLYKTVLDYRELLSRFNLQDKLKSPVSDLSGGQKQRLFIVLALIPDPEAVFMDELTTGLDARARRDVWKCLTELKAKGLTIFLTSHYMDEVEALCDRIMILKKGKTVFYGTVAEAIKQGPCDTFEDTYLWYTDEEGTYDENL